MFVVVVKNKVTQDGRALYIEASKRFAEDMKTIPGCKQALLLVSNEASDVIVNFEVWESKEVFEAYDGSVFLKYKSSLKPYFLGNTTETYIA